MKNYKVSLISSLNKLHDSQTTQQGINECIRIFNETDSYSMIISTLIEQNHSTKMATMREQIKIFGTLASIIRQNIYPYINQILLHFLKKLKEVEEMSSLLLCVAETLGKIVQYLTFNDMLSFNSVILKPLLAHLQNNSQHSLCLTRIVQFLPVDLLEQNSLYLLKKFINLLQCQHGKADILEGMAAIILSVEQNAPDFADEVLPILAPILSHQAWQVKKMALDVLYSLAVLSPDKLLQYPQYKTITQRLKQDRIKQVRESALIVYEALHDSPLSPVNSNRDEQEQADPKLTEDEQEQDYRDYRENRDSRDFKDIRELRDYRRSRIDKKQVTRTQSQLSITPQPVAMPPLTIDQKLNLAIEAMCQLTTLLQNKGIADESEIGGIAQILQSIKTEQQTPQQNMYQSITPKHTNLTSRSIENFQNFPKLQSEETFISKEAAEILKEFRERSEF